MEKNREGGVEESKYAGRKKRDGLARLARSLTSNLTVQIGSDVLIFDFKL